MKHILKVKTHTWVKEAIVRQYGETPLATLNNTIGAEFAQATLEIEMSERLFDIGPRAFEGFFTRMMVVQLIAFVDAQRQMKVTIEKAIENFLSYMHISEEKMPIETALKLYKYHHPKINKL